MRNTLFANVLRTIPHTRKLCGDDVIEPIIARYLEDVPIESRNLRGLSLRFAEWLAQSAGDLELPHPSLPELVHWEVGRGRRPTSPRCRAAVVGRTAALGPPCR